MFCYPIWFVVHVLAAQSGRLGLGNVVAGNQLFTDNPRQSWLCWPDGKIWGLGLQPLEGYRNDLSDQLNEAEERLRELEPEPKQHSRPRIR
ncbi:TPA: hypothetical protein P2Q48_004446 [Aeromonas salmonicida]|nr:hypothetical protein [Aeromonas salmonicida]HDO1249460.1 hypothetical protein [Aeromonas salmonicida]